jgi:hypothetical protein
VETLFVVVNKLDLVSDREVEGIIAYVRERLSEGTGGAELRVCAISARSALAARLQGDRAGLVDSGLPALEQQLVQFLTTDKSRVFLRQMAGRAERVLARAKLDLELGRVAHARDTADSEARSGRFGEGIAELLEDERRLGAGLLNRVGAQLPPALLECSGQWSEELSSRIRPELDQRWPPPSGRATRDDLEQASASIEGSARDFLEHWREQRAASGRALLLRIAGDGIAKLLDSSQSVQRLGAEAFDLSIDGLEPESTAWSPGDLPPLSVRFVAFDLRLNVPWWFSCTLAARREREGRRLLLDALEGGIASYCPELREALVEAACRSAQELAIRVETDIRESAERLRRRLRLPGTERHVTALQEIEGRLGVFREELLVWNPGPVEAQRPQTEASSRETHFRASIPPCVICEETVRASVDSLARAQYELATREDSRAAHGATGGFCPLHTWQYAQTASVLGISLVYAQVADSATDLLREAEEEASTGEKLRAAVAHLIPGRDRCPVCRAADCAERDAVARLISSLPVKDDLGEPAPALCFPHLAAVLAADSGLGSGRSIARRLADVLERAADDMRTYALKRESLRRDLLNDEEQQAYLQVIARMAGHQQLARPWRDDDELS